MNDVRKKSVKRFRTLFIITFIMTAASGIFFLPAVLTDTDPVTFYRGIFPFLNPAWGLPPEPDTDADGVPDRIEKEAGLSATKADEDGDGLSDYEELFKYKTDPNRPDSDGDGVADSAWDERREYTYTIRAVVDLRPPYSLADMNDFYQDARLVAVLDDFVCRIEVILYPDAHELLNPALFTPVNDAYTQPTFTKNWDETMRRNVRQRIGTCETDLHAVIRILSLLNEFAYVSINDDLGYSTDLPIQFEIFVDESGDVARSYSGLPLGYSIDEIEKYVLFARDMYEHKTRGACSSFATIRGAALRAAGLRERTVFSIPLFYWLESDGTTVAMTRAFPTGMTGIARDRLVVADHFYNEVKIGNRWIRADNSVIDTGLNNYHLKLLACHDQTSLRFPYWNYDTWLEKRPYRYVSITDQEAVKPDNI